MDSGGVSLDRIRELLRGEQAPVPSQARAIGFVEVRSHLMVADGVDLVIEPGRAGLSPEQVRNFIKDVMVAFSRVSGGDAASVVEAQKKELKGEEDGPKSICASRGAGRAAREPVGGQTDRRSG